jgi:hypothetical protein
LLGTDPPDFFGTESRLLPATSSYCTSTADCVPPNALLNTMYPYMTNLLQASDYMAQPKA